MPVKVSVRVSKDTIDRISRMSASWRANAPRMAQSPQMQNLLDFIADTAADAMVGKPLPKRVFKARSFRATAIASGSNVRYTTVTSDSAKINHISTKIPLHLGLHQYNIKFGRKDFTGAMSRSIRKEITAQGKRRIGFLPRTNSETTITQKPSIYIRSVLGGVGAGRTFGLGGGMPSARIPRILAWIRQKGWQADLGEKETARMRRRGLPPNIVLAWKLIKKWEVQGIKENNVMRDWWTANGPTLRTLIGRITRDIVQEASKELLRPLVNQG